MRYQKVYNQIWHDERFRILSEDARTLFLYLITCPHGNAIGLFVLPEQYAIADLGWEQKRYGKPFAELLQEGMILYDPAARLLCIKNHLKHNPMENENQAKSASKLIASLPRSPLYSLLIEQLQKQYHKPLVERLQERYVEPETEAVTEAGTETEAVTEADPLSGKPDFDGIVLYLNQKTNQNYRAGGKETRKLIQSRWNDGFRIDDFRKAIDNMSAKWLTDPKMSQYLRPLTLFGTKFESYLNAKVTLSDKGIVSQKTEKSIAVGQQWLRKHQGQEGHGDA